MNIKSFFKNKKQRASLFYMALLCVFVLLFGFLFSLCIFQSDDYSYATYFKNGVGEFFSLTKKHFLNTNGRVFVHIMAQLHLSLPAFLRAVMSTLILFFTAFFASLLLGIQKKRGKILFMVFFYFLCALIPLCVMKETFLWHSGFYNYVFPASVLFSGLYLLRKKSPFSLLLLFLSGATTEQWGLVALCAVFLEGFFSLPLKNIRSYIKAFFPVLVVLLGYVTIFLSPATASRASTYGHLELSESIIDLPRLSEALFDNFLIIALFILLTILWAFVKKIYPRVFLWGIFPLFLIVTLPLHHSFLLTAIILFCFLVLCCAVFYLSKNKALFTLVLCSMASVLIMIPTNTFDARITLPFVFFLIFTSAYMLCEVFSHFKNPAAYITPALCLLLAVFVLFPSFKGFYHNYKIDIENLSRVKEAQKTKVLYYNIDYDKKYAMRQMFNDGWFYTEFLKLYSLTDCKVHLVSENSRDVVYKGETLEVKAFEYNNSSYIPVRAFLEETGGTIDDEGDIVMTLSDKTLTLSRGMLFYTENNVPIYHIANENKLPDFYTLCIREDIMKKAFDF